MENNSLLQQIATMKQSFLDEEILDEQFSVVESLSTDDDPDFAENTLDVYFNETNELLATIEEQLEKNPVDFSALDRTLHKFKGCSSSVGAKKVKNEVIAARVCCDNGDVEGVKAVLEKVKMELGTFKTKIDSYFQLVKQAKNPK